MSVSKRQLVSIVLLGVFCAASTSLLARATADDDVNLIGTWKLNLAKSRFGAGAAPLSQVRVYEPDVRGIKATITTTYSDGHSSKIVYVAAYDSVEYPLTGSTQYDAIALRRVNDSTAEAKLIHAGKEIAAAQRVISEDGKTMTITFTHNLSGEESTNVSVFEKQSR